MMRKKAVLVRISALAALALALVGCQSPSGLSRQVAPYSPELERSGAWYAGLHPQAEPVSEDSASPAAPAIGVGADSDSDTDSAGVSLRALKRGDIITIYLQGIPEPQQIEDVIDESGNVSLPHVGEVRMEGRTTSEAEGAIREAYITGEIYRQINVTVVSKNDEFFVRGEVKREGRYQLTGGLSLVQGISVAGGYTEFSNAKKVQIMRGGQILKFNVNDIYDGKLRDPLIRRGDVIVVPRRWIF